MYGNRDLAAYEDGRRDVERLVRRFVVAAATKGSKGMKQEKDGDEGAAREETGTTGEGAGGEEDGIMPKELAKAYLERLAGELRERAEAL